MPLPFGPCNTPRQVVFPVAVVLDEKDGNRPKEEAEDEGEAVENGLEVAEEQTPKTLGTLTFPTPADRPS